MNSLISFNYVILSKRSELPNGSQNKNWRKSVEVEQRYSVSIIISRRHGSFSGDI
ncbi:MAG: hypothetical protein M1382_02230 [Candidatus Marsarchaeota archaeon]|nr:hypothetical protein [Candidatus Marsarchaeota archaeon]